MPARFPQAFVEIGGVRLLCLGARVNRTSKRKSDTFSADLSITYTASYGFDFASWCAMEQVECSIIFSLDPSGADQKVMMSGMVDTPEVDPFRMTVTLSGRDKSSSLAQKKRTEKFVNQKSSDIAGKIAKEHGLKLSIGKTGDFAGKLFNKDTALLALNRSDWEIMSDLAAREGCRWFVDGDTLYFQPTEQDKSVLDVLFVPPVPGQPAQGNCTRLKLSRNMIAARPHTVTVASWHAEQRKLYKHSEKLPGQGEPIEYRHHHNGRTQAEVERLAKSRLANHTRHELSIAVGMPGRLDVDVDMKMRLSGTRSIYDQPYDIDAASFVMQCDDWGGTFDMDLTGKSAKEGRAGKGSGGGSSANASSAKGSPTGVPLPPPRPPELGGTVAT